MSPTHVGSHCVETDGSFNPVCAFVIGVGIFVGLVSVICVAQIVKLCVKHRRDKSPVDLSTFMLHNNSREDEAEIQVVNEEEAV